jgi:hypothetical protein
MRQLLDLEAILQQLVAEHGKLLRHVEAYQAAMRAVDLKAMDAAGNLQEATRLRINGLESRRRLLTQQIARLLRVDGDLTLTRLAELQPARRAALLKLRDELRSVMTQVAARSHVAGKLAGAVLGHLNTVVRLLAGAVEQAGVYTKHGVPQVSARIGVMEAVA